MQAKTGDVNGDGAVNSLDALSVMSYDAGLTEPADMNSWRAIADVSCDSVVNSVDASLILQHDAGLYELRP